MKRREFIGLICCGAAAWPVAAPAQQLEKRRRIAVLIGSVESDPSIPPRLAALKDGLKSAGWVDGQNLKIDYHWTAGDRERTLLLARDLSEQTPDLIVAHTPPVASALRAATRTIPIVFVQVTDPVGAGLAESLARPGGNMTGFTTFEFAMGTKWLELLKELVPPLKRVGIMQFAGNPAWQGQLRAVVTQASSSGLEIVPLDVENLADIERAIPSIGLGPESGLIVMPDSLTLIHRKTIVALTARHWLPAIYPFRYFTDDGGLISYGIDLVDIWARAALYVDRVLRGALTSDLPIQQPTKYELVINHKTAKSLNLVVPATLLARADEVIE
jgi:putative ABC transport system substrate-binding protein